VLCVRKGGECGRGGRNCLLHFPPSPPSFSSPHHSPFCKWGGMGGGRGTGMGEGRGTEARSRSL
jgi:hypothetical protein